MVKMCSNPESSHMNVSGSEKCRTQNWNNKQTNQRTNKQNDAVNHNVMYIMVFIPMKMAQQMDALYHSHAFSIHLYRISHSRSHTHFAIVCGSLEDTWTMDTGHGHRRYVVIHILQSNDKQL